MRANVNIARKQRHTRTLENFKGVDLSSSPLRVSTQRATYMRNLWSENGANHKRPGWRELFKLPAKYDGVVEVEGKVNGIFPFEEFDASGGVTEVLLVHVGNTFYRMVEEEGEWKKTELNEYFAIDNQLSNRYVFDDANTQCFYRDGRAYIVGCGYYLVYGDFGEGYTLKNVSDIAYVPTTTAKIAPTGYGTNGLGYSLDAVNLLTSKRRNTLIGETKEVFDRYNFNADYSLQWKLDGVIKDESKFRIRINMIVWTSEEECERFELKCDGATAPGQIESWHYWEMDSSEEEKLRTALKKAFPNGGYDDVNSSPNLLKFWLKVRSSQGMLIAFLPVITEGLDDFIEFEAEGVDAQKIAKCTTGVAFGTDGGSNRLFLSGNPLEKGVDRWSEADDFTYFPEGNAMFVGGGESAITGYTRLSDGTLGIFKEERAGTPSIYYRTGEKTVMEDANGVEVPVEYFPVKAGMAGEGLIAPRAMANLAGDPLILTSRGVFGVELSQNVASGERYAKERSRAIREELCKKDLSAAVGFTHRGKYYLSVGDGTCYVADARYKTSFDGTPDVGYEWWVWDNVPATAFAEIGGELAFGTADGRVCVFENGTFFDFSKISVESGHFSSWFNYDYITYGDIEVSEGDVFRQADGIVYYVSELDKENKRFYFVDKDGEKKRFGQGYFIGTLEHTDPVVAEWASPVMDLGTSMARKTLLSLGVVLEPGVDGPVQISLETRDGVQQLRARNEHDFDFGALDFGDLSFTGSFAASTTRRMNLRNFNFIKVKMRSEEPRDMAVSGVTLEYKINQTNRGYY